ncbi:MAG: UvrD-helicase domain-containing protein [bacterium]|nr:UvrD-helicase domain-containing protein [bacterium]
MNAISEKNDFLDGLNAAQREAVTSPPDVPLLIIAGAGSGKTRVLTHRIAHTIASGVSPEHVLAITFTNKAADEMRNRVLRLITQQPLHPTTLTTGGLQPLSVIGRQSLVGAAMPFVGTFHALALLLLRRDAHRLGIDPRFSVADDADTQSVMKRVMKQHGVRPDTLTPSAALGRIGHEKSELRGPDDMRVEGANDELVRTLYRAYQTALAAEALVDFDDLLFFAVRMLQQHEAALAGYQRQFRHILVDEYQDTNTAQYVLVKLLAAAHRRLTVVGDDYQAIYGWRGADFRNMLNFKKDYPEARTITLEQNYRSTQMILDAADGVIQPVAARSEKSLKATRAQGKPVMVTECANENDEAAFVIETILSLRANGLALSDAVILYRTNAQSRPFEELLVRSRIPYRIAGGLRFYERKEIKDMLAWLRYLKNPRDLTSLARIINTPPRGIGKIGLERITSIGLEEAARASEPARAFAELIHRLRALLPKTPLSQFLKTLAKTIEYRAYLRATYAATRTWREDSSDERWDNIEEFFTVASRYDILAPDEALERFLEDAALFSGADAIGSSVAQGYGMHGAAASALNLMTMHLTKGLEFDAVFVTGCEEGLLPHARSLFDPTALDEERRLCYVALTRAKNIAHLTYARRRRTHGEYRSTMPSRFIADIPERLIEFQSRGTSDLRYDPYDEDVIEIDDE